MLGTMILTITEHDDHSGVVQALFLQPGSMAHISISTVPQCVEAYVSSDIMELFMNMLDKVKDGIIIRDMAEVETDGNGR